MYFPHVHVAIKKAHQYKSEEHATDTQCLQY